MILAMLSRTFQFWIWGTLALIAAVPAVAEAPQVVVAPSVVSPILAPLDRGIDAWVTSQLRRQGVAARLGGSTREPHPSLALRVYAAEGQAQVKISLIENGDRVLSVSKLDDTLELLGSSLASGLAATIAQLPGTSPGALASPIAPPTLPALAAYERATELLEAGRLRDAWSELAGYKTATASRLQESILVRAKLASTPATERSRLASLRGERDDDWFTVRQGLIKGRDARFLIAGAEAAVAREDRKQALKLYSEVLQFAPDQPDALRGKAMVLSEGSDAHGAREALRQAVERFPEDPKLLSRLAANPTLTAKARQHFWDRAGELHARSFETSRALGAWSHEEGGAQLVRKGDLLLRLGNDEKAKVAFEKAVEVAPSDASAWSGLGQVRLRKNDSAGAESAYRKALEIEPARAQALSGLGRVLVQKGETANAIEPLSKAVALDPTDASARRTLSSAYRTAGDRQRALSTLDATGSDPLERSRQLVDIAAIHREAGDLNAATQGLQEAIRIDPTQLAARSELAEIYGETGDEAGQAKMQGWLQLAEAARIEPAAENVVALTEIDPGPFVGLLESFGVVHPETRAPIRRVSFLGLTRDTRWQGRLREWTQPREIDLARLEQDLEKALAGQFQLIGADNAESAAVLDELRGFTTDRTAITKANHGLGTDAIAIARVRASRKTGQPVLEVRMLMGATMTNLDAVAILSNKLELRESVGYSQINPRVFLPAGLLLLGLIALLRRGWGSLQVDIAWDRDPAKKGFFHIQLSKTPGKVQQAKRKDRDGASRGFGKKAKYTRFARSLVEPRTLFRWLPARETYVCVYGLLQDEASGKVIGSFLEEKLVKIDRGDLLKVQFDLRKHECAVRLQLARPDESRDATILVAVRNASLPVRFVRDAETVVALPVGRHRVVFGFEDRGYQLDLEVRELGVMVVPVRLGNSDNALFTGCPEAVEPFVSGDLSKAADLIGATGQTQVADRIRADFLRDRGEAGEAARLYEAAGDLSLAAEVSAESDDVQHSATLFQEAGDFKKAAQSFVAAGDMQSAAQAFEADYDYDSAIDAYREISDLQKVLELLEKTGRCFEAAIVADEQGDAERAIRNLQQVDIRDPDYVDATGRLAAIFAEREEWGLASEKIRAAIGFSGDELAPLNMLEQLGSYLEKADQPDEALEVYEKILLRDFTYPGLEARVQELRDKVANRRTQIAESQADTRASSGRRVDERYELLEEVGRGGMGIVYKAKDKRLGRVVALKQLPDNLKDHPTAIQLFLREARSAAALNHPNIVTLFDADETEDNYYITMELLEGHPLDQILKSRGRLRARDAARLAIQVATGLQYAHANRIIHRDIKTSNLFFTNDKVVKIMDFGLAKMVEEVRRAATVIGGTPYYMAPEQAAGETVDHRADLYAFGVTLFEWVVGSVPFKEGDVNYHHRHTPPPHPCERVPEVPEPFAELILHMMAKEPDQRPADAGEIIPRLQAMIGQA